MKAFTSLMKILIAVVSIALTVMLVMEAAPLVMGGVNIDETEQVQVGVDGIANIKITGCYTITSELEQDISDLEVQAYLVSSDGSLRKDLISIGPVTINKENPNVPIVLDESIPVAELAIFLITDNMGSGEPGIYLPVTLAVSGSYSNNLAGIHMDMTYKIKMSDSGLIQIDPADVKVNSEGKVTQASVDVTGLASEFSGLIPAGGAEFNISFGGHEIDLNILKDGGTGDLEAIIGGGSAGDVPIIDEIRVLLDVLKDEENNDVITFEFNGNASSFKPSDINSADEGIADKAKEYIPQIEGICDSLELFLDKFAKLAGE